MSLPKLFIKEETNMKYDPELAALLAQPWSTAVQRLSMLEKKRSAALEEIHFKERQLQRLDYLRHEIRKTQGGKRE